MGTVRRMMAGAAAGVCLLLLGYHTLGPSGYLALREQEREKRALEEEIHKLTLENMHLSSRVEALQKDPHEVERIARQELKLARPGEVIFVLPNNPERRPPGGR